MRIEQYIYVERQKWLNLVPLQAKLTCLNAVMARALCICLCFFFFENALFSQITNPTEQYSTKKIQVEYSEIGEYFVIRGRQIQKLKNKVRLRNDSTLVYCDSAIIQDDKAVLMGHVLFVQTDSSGAFADSAMYDGRTKIAKMYGNVALEDGNQTLFTDELTYDMDAKIATYHTGATISNGKSQISSQHGYYYTDEKKVYFKEDVLVADPDFTLRTDTMLYETDTKIAHFLAPTLITQPETKIYTESGYYNLETGVAEFDKNPQFIKEKQKGRAEKMRYFQEDKAFELYGDAEIIEENKTTTADTILYNDATGKAFLIGNAVYVDEKQSIESPYIEYDSKLKNYSIVGRSTVSDPPNILTADKIDFNDELGNGRAEGDVIYQDTAAKTTIYADTMDYNKQTDFVNAFGGAFLNDRPLMESILDADTLYLSADTLTSFSQDTAVDSSRVLLAYHDVRIFKKDLQGVCDSLVYSSQDSIFHFYAFKPTEKPPMLWADSSQFSGDTIRLQLKNNKVHRLWLRQNSLVLNSEDYVYYNQIKGTYITAFFVENEIDHMLAEGNAQAVYYALDEDRRYIGVNESTCSRMRIEFGDNAVTGIRFYTQPTGTFSPLERSAKPIKLPGFNWNETRKPTVETIGLRLKAIK